MKVLFFVKRLLFSIRSIQAFQTGAFKIVALKTQAFKKKRLEVIGSKAPLSFGEGLGVRSK
jgi:hypothetical protein